MEIEFRLSLPRDTFSVPVVRRVLRATMSTLGVVDDCVGDIEVALTEACTNVLKHAQAADEYEIVAGLDGTRCTIEVIDGGIGFDPDATAADTADLTAEHGRGLLLIQALAENVSFTRGGDAGAVVHFEKLLSLRDGAPMLALTTPKKAAAGS